MKIAAATIVNVVSASCHVMNRAPELTCLLESPQFTVEMLSRPHGFGSPPKFPDNGRSDARNRASDAQAHGSASKFTISRYCRTRS